MKKTPSRILLLVVMTAFTCLGFVILTHNTKKVLPVDQTGIIVKAANAFLNSLSAEQRIKISFAFTPQKAAVAAKFARTSTPGGPGGPPQGNGNKQGSPPGGGMQGGPPGGGGGGGKGGQFPGFIGEQYGQAVWSNYPVSDVPRLV